MTNLTLEEKKELIRMALAAREKAYVPYSDFMVGAALRAKDGRIFTGCNVENAAFTPTSCAERTALFKAVAEGVTEFTDIAVVGSRRGEVNEQITSPCGVCRQALFEFGGPELNVIMAKTPEDFIERSMDELLPFGFGPSNVAGNRAPQRELPVFLFLQDEPVPPAMRQTPVVLPRCSSRQGWPGRMPVPDGR